MMTGQARTCVIIAHWVGQPRAQLHRLLRETRKLDAGAPFDLLVVCNGGDENPLILPPEFAGWDIQVLNRENVGYNIAAWDQGWKRDARHDFYLFLQSECFLKRPGWVEAFEFRMTRDAGVGLLGEKIMWDRETWSFVRAATDRDLGAAAWPADEPQHPIDTYKALIEGAGIPPGELGTHVPSIIHFTSRAILEEIGGYPFLGASYREAVATEVGMSRLIESRGYRACQLKNDPFVYIGHKQWTAEHRRQAALRNKVKSALKRLGLRRRA